MCASWMFVAIPDLRRSVVIVVVLLVLVTTALPPPVYAEKAGPDAGIGWAGSLARNVQNVVAAKVATAESVVTDTSLPLSSSPSEASASASSTSHHHHQQQQPSPQARPKRGKVLSDDFDEQDLLRAYREIQTEYRKRAFGMGQPVGRDNADPNTPTPTWTVLTKLTPKDGTLVTAVDGIDVDETITVSMMEHPSDPLCPYVKMEAVLPVPVQDCWDFLLLDRWDETMPKMDPFYEGVDIFGEYFVNGEETDQSGGGGGSTADHATTTARGGNGILGTYDDDDHDDGAKSTRKKASPEKSAAVRKDTSGTTGRGLRRPFVLPFQRRSLPASASSIPVDDDGDTNDGSDAKDDNNSINNNNNNGLGRNSGGIHMILARKRTKRILAFGKREFVFVSVKDEPLEDGTWVSGTVSVESPARIPRSPRYTRAFQDSIAFYKPLLLSSKASSSSSTSTSSRWGAGMARNGTMSSEGSNQQTDGGEQTQPGTKLTIVCRIDLNDSSEDGVGGCIPMWLYVKTVGATGARSVLNMRRALLEEQKRSGTTALN